MLSVSDSKTRLDEDMLIYTSVKELQPKLASLYSGPDQMFLKSTCANCTFLTFDAKDCAGCHKVICK